MRHFTGWLPLALWALVCAGRSHAAEVAWESVHRYPIRKIVSTTFKPALLERIKQELGLAEGGRIDYGRVDAGIRRLSKEDRIQSIFIEAELVSGRLNLTLSGTRLRQIRNIRFEKIDPEIVEEARANLILEEGHVTDMRILAELREQLKRAYERRGYYSAEVKITIEETPGRDVADVVIEVIPNQAAIIRKIVFAGVAPQESKKMAEQIAIREGERFSQEELDASLAALKKYLLDNKYYTSKVEQADLKFSSDRSEVEISFLVKLDHRVQYVIRGNDVFYEVEIRDLMTEEVLAGLNATANIVSLIVEKYRTVGYHFAAVRVEESFDRTNLTKTVILNIEEGPKVRVDRVHFNRSKPEIGTVRTLTDGELERIYYEGAPGILGRKVYWEAGVPVATRAFQSRIEKMGYLSARVSQPKVIFSADRLGVEMFFDFELGSRTLVSGVQFEGSRSIPSQELKGALPFKTGDPFSRELLRAGREKLMAHYLERGFADVKIKADPATDVTISRDQESALIRFHIEEGIQYRVGNVSVEGNRKTKSHVVLREVKLHPGDVFNKKKIQESEEAISLLGLFSRVEIVVTDNESASDLKNITVVVREVAPGVAEIGFGATYEDPLFRLRAFGGTGYSNMFGRNHSGSVRGEVRLPISGTDRVFPFLEYFSTLGYVAPYPFEVPVTATAQLGLDSFQVAFDPNSNERTVQTRASFELRVEKKLGQHVSAIYRIYRLERTNTEVFDSNQNQIGPDQVNIIGSTGPGLVLDFRDDAFNPRKGSYHLFDVELAHPALLSASDIAFVMALSRNSFYVPLFSPFSLTAYVGFGYARSLFDGKALPEARLVNDLSLGGQPSIRGFTIRQFQPGLSSTQTAFYNVRVESGVEIFSKFKTVLFVDSGQIFPDLQHRDRHDGLGLGFRYATPVGPIAVDLAHGIGDDGKTIQFYFSIGTL